MKTRLLILLLVLLAFAGICHWANDYGTKYEKHLSYCMSQKTI